MSVREHKPKLPDEEHRIHKHFINKTNILVCVREPTINTNVYLANQL